MNVSEDILNDEEVCSYMMTKIQKEICMCKKYGKSGKRKTCPLCFNSNSNSIPRRRRSRKYSKKTCGNYGRTGCLKKPDLCTIPEHDVVTDFASDRISLPDLASRLKKITAGFLGEIRRPKPHFVIQEFKPNWSFYNLLMDNKTNEKRNGTVNGGESLNITNISNDGLLGTTHQQTNDENFEDNTVLREGVVQHDKINEGDNISNQIDVIVERYGKVNKSSLHVVASELTEPDNLTTVSKHESNAKGGVSENNSTIGDATNRNANTSKVRTMFHLKKPKLIPARDFLKRYFPLPPIASNFRKLELLSFKTQDNKRVEMNVDESETDIDAAADIDDVASDDKENIAETDDEELVKALSGVTITSVSEGTDSRMHVDNVVNRIHE